MAMPLNAGSMQRILIENFNPVPENNNLFASGGRVSALTVPSTVVMLILLFMIL